MSTPRRIGASVMVGLWPLAGLLAVTVLLLSPPPPAAADPAYPGPYRAELLEVVDGDTLRLRIHIWPDLDTALLVRLRGIDAPELRASCPAERVLARQAKALLVSLLAEAGGPLRVHAAERGTDAGRILARVRAGPTDLSTALLDHPTLIQPWPRQHDWCP